MTVINYYEELESYLDEKGKAKTFVIHVDNKQGITARSSPLPIAFLPTVIATIEAADAAHTALTVWDRTLKTLVLIPHDNILSVSIRLG